jgi:hypothetical protein
VTQAPLSPCHSSQSQPAKRVREVPIQSVATTASLPLSILNNLLPSTIPTNPSTHLRVRAHRQTYPHNQSSTCHASQQQRQTRSNNHRDMLTLTKSTRKLCRRKNGVAHCQHTKGVVQYGLIVLVPCDEALPKVPSLLQPVICPRPGCRQRSTGGTYTTYDQPGINRGISTWYNGGFDH